MFSRYTIMFINNISFKLHENVEWLKSDIISIYFIIHKKKLVISTTTSQIQKCRVSRDLALSDTTINVNRLEFCYNSFIKIIYLNKYYINVY